jgi:hypothetical protein
VFTTPTAAGVKSDAAVRPTIKRFTFMTSPFVTVVAWPDVSLDADASDTSITPASLTFAAPKSGLAETHWDPVASLT